MGWIFGAQTLSTAQITMFDSHTMWMQPTWSSVSFFPLVSLRRDTGDSTRQCRSSCHFLTCYSGPFYSRGKNVSLSLSTSLLLGSYLQKLQLVPTAWRRRGNEINFSETVTCHLLFCLGCSEIDKSHPKQGFSSFETLCWGWFLEPCKNHPKW